MLGFMKRDLIVAGKAVGWSDRCCPLPRSHRADARACLLAVPLSQQEAADQLGVVLYLAGQERNPATGNDDACPPPTGQQTGPAVTDRWQLTSSKVSSQMLQLQNNSISHPGYMRRSPMGNPPPSVRIGMMVACSQLDAAASTSDPRARFLHFLSQPPVMDLVRELTEITEDVSWTARDDNPPFNFGAVLAPPDIEEAPTSWARVLLPESMTQQYGRDARCANVLCERF